MADWSRMAWHGTAQELARTVSPVASTISFSPVTLHIKDVMKHRKPLVNLRSLHASGKQPGGKPCSTFATSATGSCPRQRTPRGRPHSLAGPRTCAEWSHNETKENVRRPESTVCRGGLVPSAPVRDGEMLGKLPKGGGPATGRTRRPRMATKQKNKQDATGAWLAVAEATHHRCSIV